MRVILLFLLLILPTLANAQEVVSAFDKAGLVTFNEELRQSSSSLRNIKAQVADLLPIDLSLYGTETTGINPIAAGGTGQDTAQEAINALTAVSVATNEYVLTKDTSTGNAIYKASSSQYSLSDMLVTSSDGAKAGTTGSTTLEKLKEIQIPIGGALRIKYDITFGQGTTPQDSGYNPTSTGRIYRNGVAVGALSNNAYNASYTTISQDLTGWSAGDLVQLYGCLAGNGVSRNVIVRNFRLYGYGGTPIKILE